MQLGFNLPISGPTSSPRSLTRIAQEGEALGYDYLTLTDHVVLPDMSVPGYPYSESGEFMSNTPTERHEQLTATAFIAAKTSRIRLVLAVLVVPHRPAVLAAKMLSTIDVLSEGRLVVGIGAGWLKAEFDAVVTTPFAERGAVTDEYLEAFRALWTQDTRAFRRPLHKFLRSDFPAAAGAAAASADLGRRRERAFAAPCRAVRRCLVSDRFQQQPPSRHAASARRRHRSAAQTDGRGWSRSRQCLGGLSCEALRRRGPAGASDGERRLFSGSVADIVADLRGFATWA